MVAQNSGTLSSHDRPAPIVLGRVRIDTPVYLAPMSGVTDLPFRTVARSLGAETVVSEMIASGEALRETRGSLKRAERALGESPHIVQLAGHDPVIMAEAARLCADLGADIVDLNFGCPARKVTRKLCGSALMRDLDQALEIVEAVVKAVDLPITVKMRTGWDEGSRNAPEFARRAQDAGVQLVTVHGRTREQKYTGQADWSFIRQVKQAAQIPVIANGDIRSIDDVEACLAASGADGVMIGRGAQGRPWFPGQAIAFLKDGVHLPDPDRATRCEIVLRHLDAILSYHGIGRGLRIARKHVAWSIHDLPGAATHRGQVMVSETPLAMQDAIRSAFGEAPKAGMRRAA